MGELVLSHARNSVEEKQPFLGGSWKQSPRSFDADVLDESAHADQEPKGHNEPPKPGIFVRGEIGRMLNDERPLGQGQTEPGQGTVTGGNRVTEAGQHQEPNPVEQERY